MSRIWLGLSVSSLLVVGFLLVGAYSLQAQQPVWADEFNGGAGAPPDLGRWAYDLGASGWGNDELQHYTESRANSYLDGNGHLVIRARKEADGRFTSARLKTAGKFAVKFGRIEARMKLPSGQGIWTAFWMLGDGLPRVPWPKCGEIDIMENIGKEPNIVHGTLHGPGFSGADSLSGQWTLPAGQRFASDFHVYGVDWREDRIRFLVDGKQFHEIGKASIPADGEWVFNQPFFLLLNLAVGGRWPGNPDASTTFPQELLVDWVRVYP